MSWQIDIARDARKELAGLHPQMQVRISKAILALEKNISVRLQKTEKP